MLFRLCSWICTSVFPPSQHSWHDPLHWGLGGCVLLHVQQQNLGHQHGALQQPGDVQHVPGVQGERGPRRITGGKEYLLVTTWSDMEKNGTDFSRMTYFIGIMTCDSVTTSAQTWEKMLTLQYFLVNFTKFLPIMIVSKWSYEGNFHKIDWNCWNFSKMILLLSFQLRPTICLWKYSTFSHVCICHQLINPNTPNDLLSRMLSRGTLPQHSHDFYYIILLVTLAVISILIPSTRSEQCIVQLPLVD